MAAVPEGTMSFCLATKTFSLSVGSIQKRLKGEVTTDARLGSNTALTAEEETVMVDTLLWTGHHHLALGRYELVGTVRIL